MSDLNPPPVEVKYCTVCRFNDALCLDTSSGNSQGATLNFLLDLVALFDVRLNESSLLPSSVAFIQQHFMLQHPPEAFLLQLFSSEQQMLVAHDTAE